MILLYFRSISIAAIALWLGRFWCETGAVTTRVGASRFGIKSLRLLVADCKSAASWLRRFECPTSPTI
jgi:hypothetical protein